MDRASVVALLFSVSVSLTVAVGSVTVIYVTAAYMSIYVYTVIYSYYR